MLQLPNGCKCSELSVTPKNWQSAGPSILKKDWFIQYYFHDPVYKDKYKNGFQARVKGMNKLKTLSERRQATMDLLDNELLMLKSEGYNPITKKSTILKNSFEIDPSEQFILALKKTCEKLHKEEHTKQDIRCILTGVEASANTLGYKFLSISEICISHMTNILDNLFIIKPEFSANRYNKYRSYLQMLFKSLTKIKVCKSNPINDIEILSTVKKIREVPSQQQMIQIDKHLKAKCYSFWRFSNIFFHSGARETELFKIQAFDVDIANYRYKVIILKGRKHIEVWKTIKKTAMPLWQEIMDKAKPDDFLFSRGLVPGKLRIRTDQIGRRWKRHVKKDLNVTADFYSLKHLNTTQIVDMLGDIAAANLNSHTSVQMVNTVYDVRRLDRKHEELKRASNPFSSNL